MNNTYKSLIKSTTLKLVNYIENESYKGWDPYDGLNCDDGQIARHLGGRSEQCTCRQAAAPGSPRLYSWI